MQEGDEGDSITAFADIQPSMIKRVYNDFFGTGCGIAATFAAKVAFGNYVGLPQIPFGSTAESRIPAGGQGTGGLANADCLGTGSHCAD
jgi:hypothetical protein